MTEEDKKDHPATAHGYYVQMYPEYPSAFWGVGITSDETHATEAEALAGAQRHANNQRAIGIEWLHAQAQLASGEGPLSLTGRGEAYLGLWMLDMAKKMRDSDD